MTDRQYACSPDVDCSHYARLETFRDYADKLERKGSGA